MAEHKQYRDYLILPIRDLLLLVGEEAALLNLGEHLGKDLPCNFKTDHKPEGCQIGNRIVHFTMICEALHNKERQQAGAEHVAFCM